MAVDKPAPTPAAEAAGVDIEQILSPGVRVIHPQLGQGEIVEWIGCPGGYRRPVVAWDDVGQALSCDPAPLRPAALH